MVEGVFADIGPLYRRPSRPGLREHTRRKTRDSPGSRISGPSALKSVAILCVSLLDAGGQAQVFRVVHPGLRKDLVLKLAARPAPNERSRTESYWQPRADSWPSWTTPTWFAWSTSMFMRTDDLIVVMEYVAGCTLDATLAMPSPRRGGQRLWWPRLRGPLGTSTVGAWSTRTSSRGMFSSTTRAGRG